MSKTNKIPIPKKDFTKEVREYLKSLNKPKSKTGWKRLPKDTVF